MCLGTAFLQILPRALAMLSDELNLDEATVTRQLAEEQARNGDDGRAGWLKHFKRTLRVSAFWNAPGKGWRLMASLRVVVRLDILAKALLGKSKIKCTLTDMVGHFYWKIFKNPAGPLLPPSVK